MSKGFTHVLEGIMAAFLLIGAVTTIVPEINYGLSDDSPSDQVRTRMEVLDRTGDLPSNLSNDEIKSRITEQVRSSYNFSVTKLELDSEKKNFDISSGSLTETYDVSGDDFEIQIFIESSSGLNVSYGGKMLLEEETEEGYYLRPASGGTKDLEVNGTGTVDVALRGFTFDDSNRPFKTVSSVKYVQTENKTSQIGVFLWQKDRP